MCMRGLCGMNIFFGLIDILNTVNTPELVTEVQNGLTKIGR